MKINVKSKNSFVSYHHENDQEYLMKLRQYKLGSIIKDYSLKDDIGHFQKDTIYKKIRAKMRGCSVTVVMIGEETGLRKWVDWEIWASLRKYNHPYDVKKSFKPNGLLGIYLPVDNHEVPDRLQDNIDSGYAITMHWRYVNRDLDKRINQAYANRVNASHLIDNRRERMTSNSINFFGFKF